MLILYRSGYEANNVKIKKIGTECMAEVLAHVSRPVTGI